MIDFDAYDDLLAATYRAGAGRGPLGEMLMAVRGCFDAASAGFSVYDDAGERITHTVFSPPTSRNALDPAQMRSLYENPGVSILTRPRFPWPRRLSDLVPLNRLKSARWFRLQAELSAMGHGMVMDLEIETLRARAFVMRGVGARDFTSADVDLLGRIGRHIGRAFAGHAHLLSPDARSEGSAIIVSGSSPLAASLRSTPDFASELAEGFGLTPAEVRVASLLAGGMARAAAAAKLGMSLNTLKTHARRCYRKLGIMRATELSARLARADSKSSNPASRARPV